uniref:NADH dehydrogenase subunit 3 n=1 Tax=Cyphonia clavata TaxID=104817 RepID=UPI0022FDAFB5|nr:NADH dehydrogenase subunit 3 [Cyphonia clavata]WAP90803.1 NADH dehydrogenase subunit 3 [Cyphonia clavata]
MMLIMMQTTMILTLLTMMMSMMIAISKKKLMDTQKASPFECGFNPMSNKRLPLSIHFFMIAIIFLIFDIEIIIIIPTVTTMKYTMIKYWAIASFTFIMILIMGLYYEWYNGLINWAN